MLLIIIQNGLLVPVFPVVEFHFVALGGFFGEEFGKVHRVGRIDALELAGGREMIPGGDVMGIEKVQNILRRPGIVVRIAAVIIDAVQLRGLGSHILHDVEQRIRAAVFGIAVAHEIGVAHPRLVVCLAVGRRQKIPDRSSRPGSELLAFDSAEFDGVALVNFLINVGIIIVPGRHCNI